MSRRIACVRIPRRTAASAPPDPLTLVSALLRAAPRVTPVDGHPNAYWADATGVPGGDEGVARALIGAAADAGFPDARAAVAGTCIAAAAATRERGSRWRVVPQGRDAEFLRRRSLAVIPMPDALRESFDTLGVATCGLLADLSASDVELRFGADGLRAWRLASGQDPRWPFRPASPDVPEASVDLDFSLEGTEPLRFLLPGLVGSVISQAALRQHLPAALTLVLSLEDRSEVEVPVRPARPTAESRVLVDMALRALERTSLAAPISALRLVTTKRGAALADQLDAFQAAAPDPAAVQAALLPVIGRWGEGAFVTAEPQGAHLPGRRGRWLPVGEAAFRAPAPPDRLSAEMHRLPRADTPAAMRLLDEPEPLIVETDDTSRPRVILAAGEEARASGVLGRVMAAEGPERLSGDWWSDSYAREYWRTQTDHGPVALVYRETGSGQWYLEGWFD